VPEIFVSLKDLARLFTAQVLARSELFSWLWLTGSLIAIDLLYRLVDRPKSESFWSYSTPRRIYTHPSAILDLKFIVVQRLVIAFVIAPMLVSALALGKWGSTLLAAWLGPGPAWTAGPGGLALFGAISLVLFDVGHFISHYIQHKTPFFWEFHKIHHAAEVLTPVTAFRVHPVENILDSVIQGPLQALGLAIFYYLYGSEQSLMALVGLNVVFPLYYLVDSLRHSHLWISFGPKLEHIFSSPAQHQIHHSRLPQHLDTNFSRYFSFLDWIAGTLYIPKKDEALDFGLSEGADRELGDVWSLYWVPMKRAFRQATALPRTAKLFR
jgi:sterol desaturase/sphingolipid hydroxylase (fatty acid hydroxylase superfamily)